MTVEPFIGEINILPYPYTPLYYVSCNGQLLQIGQFTSLFAVILVAFGGNGRTDFAVPNLKGRAPLHRGQSIPFGHAGGTAFVELSSAQIPSHNHEWTVLLELGANNTPGPNDTLGLAQQSNAPGAPTIYMYSDASASLDKSFSPSAVQINGLGQGHPNRQPYLALNFCMALDGIFPARN